MSSNSAIIATNASFFANKLLSILQDTGLPAFIVASDCELVAKIKMVLPKYVFLENCFNGYKTDEYIQQIAKQYRDISIAVWATSEVRSQTAVRYIAAGAESYFSLRDTESNIETIICKIVSGRHYYPADVKEILDRDCAYPLIGKDLTAREIEIMKLTITGKTNQQIGDVLSLSAHTVKFYKTSIYRKCGGNTPIDILRNGLIRGIIRTEDLS